MRRLFSKVALVVGFCFALAFTFGCSFRDDDDGSGKSSPSGILSSSSDGSSMFPFCNGGTVTIGTQTWQKCNLNVEPSTGESSCYDNDPTNCSKYGRLYNWAAAMALPANCNSSSCSSQIGAKHRGICPSGWHIPSDADWNTLMKFVNPSCSSSDYYCNDAGTKLKAVNGWDYDGKSGNGTDYYGFSALPGGGYSVSYFDGIGGSGAWWSASENDATYAHFWTMSYNTEYVGHYSFYKIIQFSVRCLKD